MKKVKIPSLEGVSPEELRRAREYWSRQPSKTDWKPGDRFKGAWPFFGVKGHIESVDTDAQVVMAKVKVHGKAEEDLRQFDFRDIDPEV